MKVKFYKGPYHNKTKEIDEIAYNYGGLRVSQMPKIKSPWQNDSPYDSEWPQRVEGTYLRTNHTHPDGSTFFVWQGWKK